MKLFVHFLALALSLSQAALGQITVQSGLSQRIERLPGQQELLLLKLKNVGDKPCAFFIELADLASHCDSGYRYLPPGSTDASCAAWLEAETYSAVLRANEETIVKVRMRIPKNFNRSSARACLLVTSKPEKDEKQNRSHLNVELRYAVNVLYRNPIVTPVVAMEAKALAVESGNKVWALRYQNSGNVDRIISSRAHVLNDQGHIVYQTQSLHAKGMIPNQCRTVQFENPDLPPGNYQMVVVSQTDKGEKFGLTHTLKL